MQNSEIIFREDPASRSPLPSVRQQLIALRTESKRTRHALDIASQKLKETESEIADFLEDYIEKVSPYADALENIENELREFKKISEFFSRYSEGTPRTEQVTTQSLLNREASKRLNHQIKDLYHTLAKKLHPDLAGNQSHKPHWMAALNEAFDRQSAADMWAIAFHSQWEGVLDEKEDEIAITQLRQRVIHMHQALQELEDQKKKLELHPSFQLMRRALQLKLCGQDLTQNTIKHLSNEIRQKRRELLNAKLSALQLKPENSGEPA